MNSLLNTFAQKLDKEILDTDFSSLYEDVDILGGIEEYDLISQMLDDDSISKENKKELQKEFNKIERNLLLKNKLIKLKGDEKSYYCLRGTVYDNVGMMIDDNYSEYIEDDNIFCEYVGDTIYLYMKNLLYKKIKKYSEQEEFY